MEKVDALTAVLRCCARIDLDLDAQRALCAAASQVRDWGHVGVLSEDHGLSPLVRHHVRHCEIPVPDIVSKELAALAVRHRLAGGVQTAALVEILEALDRAAISHVVLKGAALAHGLYPRPELRPMRDLDILVAPGQGVAAQAILRDAGYQAPPPLRRRAHHHLPVATAQRDGFQVSVEIHEDALSVDQMGTLTLNTMAQPREILIGGRRCTTFGHVDMLRHLTAHMLEPRARTRLIHVTDLVWYAAHFAQEIDWDRVNRSHPRVVNALSLMEYVTPLPGVLDFIRPPSQAPEPRDAGLGFPPLSTVAFDGSRLRQTLVDLLYPSEWWMRAFYGVAPGRSLTPARWSRHLWRLSYWGIRRLANL
jgi:hypothetical protein